MFFFPRKATTTEVRESLVLFFFLRERVLFLYVLERDFDEEGCAMMCVFFSVLDMMMMMMLLEMMRVLVRAVV